MSPHSVECPNCHQNISVEEGATSASCAHCGAIVEDIPADFFDSAQPGAGAPPQPGYGPAPQQPPGYGAPPQGPPGYGAPPQGPPPYGAPPYGAPPYGAPPYGAPMYGPPRAFITPQSRISHAGLGKRFIAFLVDWILLFIVQVALAIGVFGISIWGASGSMTDYELTAMELAYSAVSMGISLGYYIILEAKTQQTLGKMLLGIIVIKEDFTPAGTRESLIRNGLRILYQIPCIGIIIYIVDAVLILDDEQRIGDRVAGTFVVEKEDFERLQAGGMGQPF